MLFLFLLFAALSLHDAARQASSMSIVDLLILMINVGPCVIAAVALRCFFACLCSETSFELNHYESLQKLSFSDPPSSRNLMP